MLILPQPRLALSAGAGDELHAVPEHFARTPRSPGCVESAGWEGQVGLGNSIHEVSVLLSVGTLGESDKFIRFVAV